MNSKFMSIFFNREIATLEGKNKLRIPNITERQIIQHILKSHFQLKYNL